jgi:hypothetical protein
MLSMILRFGEPTPFALTRFVPLTNGFKGEYSTPQNLLPYFLGIK